MKPIILLFCITWISSGYAQIFPEHTYVTNDWPAFNNSFPGDDGNMDFYMMGTNTVDLYDGETHVLYKSMPRPMSYTGTANNYINYTDPAGTPVFFISKHLFNDDDLIEFVTCIQYFNPFGNGVSAPKVVISNEEGTILYQIYDRYAPRLVKTGDDSYKLLVSLGHAGTSSMFGSGSIEINVYSIPGTLSLGQQEAYLARESFQAYPNPTSNRITISNSQPLPENAELKVYDMSGNQIQSQTVAAGTIDIIVDASQLATGVYVYKINGVTGKFIKR